MQYNFEKLNIWQESRAFIKEVYKVLAHFPESERYALANQIKRAAISIALNIAEGSAKKSKKDFIRYLRISTGSIYELITALYIARDLKYLADSQFDVLYQHSHKLSAMIYALIRKLDEK